MPFEELDAHEQLAKCAPTCRGISDCIAVINARHANATRWRLKSKKYGAIRQRFGYACVPVNLAIGRRDFSLFSVDSCFSRFGSRMLHRACEPLRAHAHAACAPLRANVSGRCTGRQSQLLIAWYSRVTAADLGQDTPVLSFVFSAPNERLVVAV